MVAKQYVLGKVIEVYPGIDGLVRAVKLKTRVGEMKRPIHKLCLLPSGESADSREAGGSRLLYHLISMSSEFEHLRKIKKKGDSSLNRKFLYKRKKRTVKKAE